jgi:hemerythrin-like domain-containing protein
MNNRREFLLVTASIGLAAADLVRTPLHAEDNMDNPKEVEAEISAPEDLMREHGVLNRILLVYDEAVRRLRSGEGIVPDMIHKPATLARKFVEDYHEKLEENFIFPQFEKHQTLVDLVTVLRTQHNAGRRLTDRILHAATADHFHKSASRQEVIACCEAYVRMYRPHEAREDTVLFPALYTIVDPQEVRELGEQFEEQEHRLFGEDGFSRTVEEVAPSRSNWAFTI